MKGENGEVRGHEVCTLVCSMCIVVHTDVTVPVELSSLTTEMSKGTETLVGRSHTFVTTKRQSHGLVLISISQTFVPVMQQTLLFLHLPPCLTDNRYTSSMRLPGFLLARPIQEAEPSSINEPPKEKRNHTTDGISNAILSNDLNELHPLLKGVGVAVLVSWNRMDAHKISTGGSPGLSLIRLVLIDLRLKRRIHLTIVAVPTTIFFSIFAAIKIALIYRGISQGAQFQRL